MVSRVFPSTQPLSCLFVHDQRDVALDQGEGEEADVAGVLAGRSRLFWPGKGTDNSTVWMKWQCRQHTSCVPCTDTLIILQGFV